MGFVKEDAEGEYKGETFTYERLKVDGEVALKDFIDQANADGIAMNFVVVKRGAAKEGEDREPKGFLNYLLDALNQARYREALPVIEVTPQDKAIKALVKHLGLSIEEATKRVNG